MGKQRAARGLERLWALGFRIVAAFAPPVAERLSAAGGQRVLVLAPHPDDEAIGCAGAIMLHVAAGDDVTLAVATDGRRSRVLEDADAMAAQRRSEAADAARLLGIRRLEMIGLPEGAWHSTALERELRTLLEETSPDLIYAPSRVDFHPEHVKVAHALASALAGSAPAARRLRIYQIQVPLTSLLVNLVADVSSATARCDAVLRAYASQAGSVHCTYRHRRYVARRHRLAGEAEAFWELSVPRYVELHRTPPTSDTSAFRGLRHSPLTDPLAYLVGRRERRRMRDAYHGLPSICA